MTTIYRGQFSTLWITLQANETLGLLDSGYLEDYYGNDGQVSLYHLETDTHYPILMTEQAAETPLIPHDVFRGQASLAGLPNGDFEVRGRCRDTSGNYSILGAVQSPIGGEQVLTLAFEVKAGQGLYYQPFPGGVLAASIAARTLARPEINGGTLDRPALAATLQAALTR